MSHPYEAYEAVRVPVLVFRKEGVAVFANAAFEAMLDVDASWWSGQRVSDLIERSPLARADRELLSSACEALRSGTLSSGEVRATVRTDDRVATLQIRWAPSQQDEIVAVFLAEREANTSARISERLSHTATELLRLTDEAAIRECAVEGLAACGFTAALLVAERGGLRVVVQRGLREPITGMLVSQTGSGAIEPSPHPDAGGPRLPHLSRALAPGLRRLDAPIRQECVPTGYLIVSGDELLPPVAAAIELFAALVGGALENVRLEAKAVRRLAELERLQRALVERERLAALGETAAVVAHEVRNPLGSIVNATAVLRWGKPRAPGDPDPIAIIEEESARIEALVRDLLDLGRPFLPRRRPIALDPLARASVRQAGGEGRTEFVSDDDGSGVLLDPDLIQLALLNVVRNALQASPQTARVRLATQIRAGTASFVVEDEGPGIPPGERQKVFEPFFTNRATGTGIGLAVVKRIVEAHGGEIEVSAGEHGGARIVLRFPPAEP